MVSRIFWLMEDREPDVAVVAGLPEDDSVIGDLGMASLNLEHLEKVNAAIDHQLLYWQEKKVKVAEAKQALFDAHARVIKNNALLAKIKAEAIDDFHSLAAKQQQDLLMNSAASMVPVTRPHQNRTSLMLSIHRKLDLKKYKAGRTLGVTSNI